jgi:sulfite reductase (ferredoxin)
LGDGKGRIADKVIKVPSKRGPDVLRMLLEDYGTNGSEGELFNDYYDRRGERYFYDLLKVLTDASTLRDEDYVDWGQQEKFATAIGVGECAGVVIDLVATLLFEGEEKLEWSRTTIENGLYADGIYHAYSCFVQTAKALLLSEGVNCNTQQGILRDFDKYFIETGQWPLGDNNQTDGKGRFQSLVLQINQHEPTEEFAKQYFEKANGFYQQAHSYRNQNKHAVAK